jgi:hypothetical protein
MLREPAEPTRRVSLAARCSKGRECSQPSTKAANQSWLRPSIRAINGLRRHDQEAVELDGQQAAYQPSGNGISGQGARLSLAARGG